MSARRAFSWVAARAVYPGVLFASLALAAALLDRGLSPSVTATVVFLATLALTAALEWARPYDRAWIPSAREALEDGAYLGIAAVMQAVSRAAGELVALVAALALSDWLGPRPWPQGWPAWAQVALALALADLGKYWLHRLAHERPWLWRFHTEHHAPARMYSLNSVRLHPVNLLWNLILDASIPLALGLSGRALALAAVLRGTVSILQHANVDMRTGVLDWVFSTPALHQWHHSAALDEAQANYGSTLIVWDLLFGTRKMPSDRRAPTALGLPEGTFHPSRLRHQLAAPWR